MILAALVFTALSVSPLEAGGCTSSQPSAALRIVVVEGEDAVNIIQQKTAVAPVIEVRDRNDQPVAGAIVNFAIRSGRATFGGARTLSVTTNAAGRAIAAGFTPTGSGALQISATAAFQGQTAAAVTIAQTTVQTAAQAAAVGSAGGASGSSGGASAGAGAGAGGGGGLSATTIGIIGGAAAGGVVAARELGLGGGGGGGKTYSGQFSGTMLSVISGGPCTTNEQQTGTLEMRIDDNNGTITGSANIEGTVTLTPATCATNLPGTTDTFGLADGQVTGSAASLAFTANASNNYTGRDGSTGVNSYDYAFTGTFDGTQVTGALTITRTVTNSCCSIPTRGSVTHSVTLR
jgi:hypothetical protein